MLDPDPSPRSSLPPRRRRWRRHGKLPERPGEPPLFVARWNASVRGWTGIVLAGVVLALGGVLWLATVLVGQSRARVVDEFVAQERVHVEDSARSIEGDLNDVLEDLHFAVGWVKTGRPEEVEPQLRALLDIGHPYEAVVVVDGAGRAVLSIGDPQHDARPWMAALTASAREALTRPPGQVALVPPAAESGWRRAFTVPFAPTPGTRGALALLVDTQPFFEALPGEPGLHVVVIDGHGRALPATSPQLARALANPPPPLAEAVTAMRRGDTRTVRWTAAEANAVVPGLGETVVTMVPMHVRGAAAWSMAVLTPVGVIGASERALVVRIALTAAAIAGCLVALAGYLIVGARRGAALQLRLEHAQRLAHLRERTEKIVDNIPAAVLVLSAAGEVTASNRAFRDRAAGDAVGQPWRRAFANAGPAALDRIDALIGSARTSGAVASLPGATLALFGADGRYSVHAVPLEPRYADAQLLVVIEDLSQLRALEDQLLRAEKLATVGVLAAGIAHEIGTPLGIVRGRAEYIRGKLGEHAQSAGLLVIIEQIDLISRTIRQLLDFSRAKPAALRAVRLGPTARAVADLLRFEAERRKVTLAVDVADALPPLDADPDALQQLIVNLVMNALDAGHPGGRVAIAAAADGRPGDAVRIEVRDDGHGIAPEHRNQIFDPFFTTKKRGQGTGLGLTLCAKIVRDHGGEIEVDSEVGRGTTVVVRWPRAREDGHGASESIHPDR
jgi:two-component system, NtrC family, sensor histidine kinase HydH